MAAKEDVKLILFDFDGTLADTLPIALKSMNELASEFGYSKIKYVSSLRKKHMRQIIKELGISMIKLPFYTKKLKQQVATHSKEICLFSRIGKTVSKLRKKYLVGIVSTNSEKTIKHTLNREHLSVDFVFSDSSFFGKHQTFKKIQKKYNLKNNQMIYIGDELRDIDASKKAGIRMIAVAWGYNAKSVLKKSNPEFLVNTPKEIEKILL